MQRILKIARMPLLIAFCLLIAANRSSGTTNSGVEIVLVGDILLDRGVRKNIEKFGTGFPFEKTEKLLSEADVTFGNLENPLTADCLKSNKKYSFRAEPEYAEILSLAGFDLMSLANNHSYDCGQTGLDRTFEALDEFGLQYIGAGTGPLSDTTAIINVNGLKIGFAAFTTISPVSSGEPNTGVALAVPEAVSVDLAKLSARSDVVIVSFHWGTEYASLPNQEQTDLALLAVAKGADIVVGHHPHVLQGIQVVDSGFGKRKALIAYSLGNFVFDSPVRLNRLVGESMILKVSVDRQGLSSASIVPIKIEEYRPIVAADETKDRISGRIERLSAILGTEFRGGQIVLKREASSR